MEWFSYSGCRQAINLETTSIVPSVWVKSKDALMFHQHTGDALVLQDGLENGYFRVIPVRCISKDAVLEGYLRYWQLGCQDLEDGGGLPGQLSQRLLPRKGGNICGGPSVFTQKAYLALT